MINRCKTKYSIQIDEDMIYLNNNSCQEMLNKIKNQNDNVWQFCYSLTDYNFGIGETHQLLGMKIFNIELMKKYNLSYDSSNEFSIDRNIQIKTKSLNFHFLRFFCISEIYRQF